MQARHLLRQIGGEDEHPGRRGGDDAGQLLGVQAPVERRVDGSQLAAGKERIQMLYAVVGQNSHPVTLAHAGRVAQPVGEAVGAGVHLPERQSPLRVFPAIDDGETVGRVQFAPGQVVADVHGALP